MQDTKAVGLCAFVRAESFSTFPRVVSSVSSPSSTPCLTQHPHLPSVLPAVTHCGLSALRPTDLDRTGRVVGQGEGVNGWVAGVSSYILDKYVCATSGRLLLGVDTMTGFSGNDSFSPHSGQRLSLSLSLSHRDKQLLKHLAVKAYLQKSQ